MEKFRAGKIAEQKIQDGKPFPKVYFGDPQSDLDSILQSVKENRRFLFTELHEHGALLFRGFPLASASDFDSFVAAFGWDEQPYLGGACRLHVTGRVWTANESSLDQHIFFHHEMALMNVFPGKLLFYCEVPPPIGGGGQTAIVKSHRVASHMESKFPELIRELASKGVVTCTHMPNRDTNDFFLGKSWQSSLGTEDVVEAQKRVESRGARVEWMENGGAKIIHGPLPLMRSFDGYDGRKVWFNYIPAATYKNAAQFNSLLMGDGSRIADEVMEESGRFMDGDCVELQWQKGDVLLIDNLAVMHARRPSLPPRRVLVAVCK